MAKIKLSAMSTEAMLAEIKRRKNVARKLETKRAKLLKQIQKLDAEIAAAGGSVAAAPAARRSGGGKRVKNAMKLPDAMVKVMSTDKPMSVTQIADAVAKIGYVSNSSTFNTIIYQTLARESKIFKKVSRGQYALKG